jgi:phosphatidate cytidylyltransferase
VSFEAKQERGVGIRLVSALVALSVVIPALVFGGILAVDIMVALVGLVCVHEYRVMALPTASPLATVWLFFATAMVYVCGTYAQAHVATCVALVTIGSMMFATIWPGEQLQDGPSVAGKFLVGILWIGALLPSVPLLRRMDQGLAGIALLLVIVWMADTGAYFVGRHFGTNRLYARVSPNKSWEGVYGGIAAAVAGVILMNVYVLNRFSWLECLLLGVFLAGLGVLGDLVESLLKRGYGVKDSGKIMPGHGGFLDRIDSLLFVAPALYGYLSLMKG